MGKMKNKKQYEDAKFLGHSLKHKHNWKRMYVKAKRNKKKLMSDRTGGFLQCSICGECAFLPPDQLNKYRQLIKDGIPTAEIQIKAKHE